MSEERLKFVEIKTIWMADEESRRSFGKRSKTSLKSADGQSCITFEDTDSTIAAECSEDNSMIIRRVVDWIILPLTQRYEEMCLQTGKKVIPDVMNVLRKGQVSNCINLCDFSLTPNLAEPIFKSMMHHDNLEVLDLSDNVIQDEGCKLLAKSLSTLRHLRTLNLSGNCITSDGLESLVSSSLILNEMEELNLSQNPLGNKSVRSLARLLKGCRYLQALNLSSCGLTKFDKVGLRFNRLIDFDVSFNPFTPKSFEKLMTMLNSNRLENLNLSFCVQYEDTSLAPLIWFFENGTCQNFKRVELAGCYLTDSDIFKLIQSLSRANELEVLNLSENSMLSPLALRSIMNGLNPLRKLALANCPNIIDIRKLGTYGKSKNLPRYMSFTFNASNSDTYRLRDIWDKQWGGRGKIKKFGSQWVCYVNENDLL